MQHYTVKKVTDIPVPISGMSLTKLCLGGNNLIFSPRESMVSGIQAGDGNVADLFYGVYCKYRYKTVCGDRWDWFGVVCVCSTQAGMDAQIWLIGNSGPTTPHLSA